MLLESQDEAARLRPIWDEFANQYDAIITPSVPDEAPYGLESTGDSVRQQIVVKLKLTIYFSPFVSVGHYYVPQY